MSAPLECETAGVWVFLESELEVGGEKSDNKKNTDKISFLDHREYNHWLLLPVTWMKCYC